VRSGLWRPSGLTREGCQPLTRGVALLSVDRQGVGRLIDGGSCDIQARPGKGDLGRGEMFTPLA